MDRLTLQDKINQLPELPVELFKTAGKIDYSDNKPIITLRPHKIQSKLKSPPATALAQNKSSVWHRNYWVQVIYPKVICQPPWDDMEIKGVEVNKFFEQDNKNEVVSNKTDDIVAKAAMEHFYKLSAVNGKKLLNPWWCSVKGGPWLAQVKEDESCFDGVPSRWSLEIAGMPEVSVIWDGRFEDMPPYPSLIVIVGTLTLQLIPPPTVTCCTGYKWCETTKSCIPNQTTCQGSTPV